MKGTGGRSPAEGPAPVELRQLLGPALLPLGVTLVDCAWLRGRRGPVLRLTVDRPGGITVDECGAASGVVSELLDRLEPALPNGYSLEVSSPGAERPLLSETDFRDSLGRRVRVRLSRGGHEAVVEGRLTGVSATELELESRRRSGRLQLATVDRAEVVAAQVVVDI